jgi:chorismate dehydratase
MPGTIINMKIRVSLVHYLNSAPLGWAFLHGPLQGKFEVIPSSPADCADQLSKGEVDIGLIPSIEYQRMADLQIIPDISISSLLKVRSLLLIKPKGKSSIDSVALDTSSRTTVALTKILLHEKMGLRPEFVSCPPELKVMLDRCDAALLIGDPALQVKPEEYDTIDLVEAWVEWQKTPFVCAFWACRKSAKLPADLNSVFLEAKEWGLNHFPEIAESFTRLLGLPAVFLENYLTHNINFDLKSGHLEGLMKFYQLAKKQGLIPEIRPLEFHRR